MADHAGAADRARHLRRTAATRRQLRIYARRLGRLAGIVVALLLLGALGLALSEKVGYWYALRWAIDTAATVGGFPQPRTVPGQIVHLALVLVGVGTLFYALATVAELFLAGHLADLLTIRRMQRNIDSLTDHHIICGFGRVGRQVARDLQAGRADYVVIDSNPESRDLAESLGLSFIEGDAAEDAVLAEAGIERARSVIVCADSDANNVFITLTARELRADIAIVARAAMEDTEKKLKRAGADRVISPYKASGNEMARLALHPQLGGVMDVDDRYRVEEIVVDRTCQATGRTLGEIRGSAIVVGLRRGEEFHPQPSGDLALRAGDVLIALGAPSALERLVGLMEDHPG